MEERRKEEEEEEEEEEKEEEEKEEVEKKEGKKLQGSVKKSPSHFSSLSFLLSFLLQIFFGGGGGGEEGFKVCTDTVTSVPYMPFLLHSPSQPNIGYH